MGLLLLLASLLIAAPAGAQHAASAHDVDAGLGRGVTVRSPDDRASMTIRARIQLPGTLLDDASTGTTEVSIRRARLVFQGNADGPGLTYYIQLSFSNLDTEADLRLPLRDAYVTWAPARDLVVGANLGYNQNTNRPRKWDRC